MTSLSPSPQALLCFTAALALSHCTLETREIPVISADAGSLAPSPRECSPDTAACVSSTQRRVCTSDGRWQSPETCANACVEGACAGVCIPGSQRCASESEVERCSEVGQWEAPTPCPNACVEGGCTDECAAGVTECYSASQVRLCNDRGQWQTPLTCEFACVGDTCGGECSPDIVRCEPDAEPERCDELGSWRAAPRCVSPGSECPVGSVDRCDDVCTSLENDPQNCGACGRSCQGGVCAGGVCQALVLAEGLESPSAIALSATHVFLREGSGATARILRLPKGGGTLETVAQGVGQFGGPALAGQQLYYPTANSMPGGGGQVMRANLDGTETRAFSPLHSSGIFRLITPGLFVYYTIGEANSTVILRAPLLSQGEGGSATETRFEVAPGPLLAMTVVNGCLFYVDQADPTLVLRKCSPTAMTEPYFTGQGAVTFRSEASVDDTHLYLADAVLGVARIPLQPPATSELIASGAAEAPIVDDDEVYYVTPSAPAAAAGCSTDHALYRASKPPAPSASELLGPPLACPTALATDADAIYWLNGEGAVLRLPK